MSKYTPGLIAFAIALVIWLIIFAIVQLTGGLK